MYKVGYEQTSVASCRVASLARRFEMLAPQKPHQFSLNRQWMKMKANVSDVEEGLVSLS